MSFKKMGMWRDCGFLGIVFYVFFQSHSTSQEIALSSPRDEYYQVGLAKYVLGSKKKIRELKV